MEYSLGMWVLRQRTGRGETGVGGLIEYLFIYLCLGTACGLQAVSFLTRGRTYAPCSGSWES